MENISDSRVFFEYLSRILIRSFLMGLVLLIIWQLAMSFSPGWMFSTQAHWFGFDEQAFKLVNYCGMGLMKLTLIIFFFFPYLSIKIVLKSSK